MDRNIKLFALFSFFIEFAFYSPIAILYFARITGSYVLGMSIFSAVMLASAIFEVPTGIFSDRIGRKNTLVAGAIASALGVVAYALGGSYFMLLIGALFEGLGRSFYSGNNQALLHDFLSASKQQHKFHDFLGKLTSIEHVGLAIVAATGSILANWSFALVMWFSIIPKLANVVIAYSIDTPPKQSHTTGNIFAHLKTSLGYYRNNWKLRYVSMTSIIKFALGESAFQFRAVFVASLWPLWAVGFSHMLSQIGAAIGYYFSGKIIDRFKAKRVLVGEIIINRLINIFSLVFPTILSPALMGATSLSYGAGSVATSSLLQKEFTDTERATMGSLNAFFGSLGFAIAAVSLGFIADSIGPAKTLILVHLLLFTPLWFYQKIFKST